MNDIITTDKDQFLDYRKQQEKLHFSRNDIDFDNPLSSILTIEINTTELCNRTCVFCPRHNPEVFPNRNLNMSTYGASLIAKHLSEANYKGKISLSGFGENTLNNQFPEIIRSFRNELPDNIIECNTNGDFLTQEYAENLFEKGLSFLYINCYDGPEQMDHFSVIMKNVPTDKFKFRMHWSQADHGLILNNRSGTIDWIGIEETDVKSLQGKPCHYPFYKMFVDWNGDVLFCSNDWGREHVIGNLIQDSLFDVWFSKPMRSLRRKLRKGDRSNSPCNKCSVDGTLFGKQSFEVINDYEDRNNGYYRPSRKSA